ncbi:Pimeloyl-ACP methyl ester carboxylesterase [Raineyella antarctica]|uniref:Pimeloyl-ACP methyl ester carboxylesterase n=1 Tax=Raineyella antarctica TaxID=1577474 RepID=A0A1G6IMJ1_9ACTN|nr:alpha/beta hydrolase [Raineyella antarctica]SDC07650.1 Pimeloyl-ACP methyl ester carboxylesterase [Raineyella antarctica]
MPAPVRLILVPGTRFSTLQWEPYRVLLPDVEVVPVDLPGHGTRLGQDFTSEAAVAVIAEAVAAGTPEQRVVVAGHSLGGFMAMLYAAHATTQPDALVLLGATADPSSPGAVFFRGFIKLLEIVGPDRMSRAMNRIMHLLGARGDLKRSLPDGAAYAALPAAWEAVMAECRPQLLEELRCPVVLANGQYDQMRAHVRRFAAHCQEAHVVTIRGATHLFPVTHPRQVTEVLGLGVRLAQG